MGAVAVCVPMTLSKRLALLADIGAHPGSTVAEAARRLGVHHSTATYHLHRLQDQGIVVLQRHRGRVLAFLAGTIGPQERARTITQRWASTELVLARVAAEPRRLGALARDLPMTKAAVYWHLTRLAALSLVVMEGAPRARTYRLPAPPQPTASALKLAAVPG